MVFSGIFFLFRFLPVFLICYFVAQKRMKNFVLFLGSLFFYAWGEPVYVLLMLFSTFSDYFHGLLIERYQGKTAAKALLVSSVVINLGLLGFFKYSGLPLPLPVGISFYTFQTMSYTIDVYRGEVGAQKNLLDFGVFVTMFPQLVAGPIVKYKAVAEELNDRHATVEDIAAGAARFVIGLAKKVLFANNIGLLFAEISSAGSAELTLSMAWLGMVAYAFQIYFDFSGYSDMAIGLGRILGFHFPENFNYPYLAESITDFWRRWHMSLGGWFREYVYIPLGGNKKGRGRQLWNILVVWALTGIWHGAGWNFLLWGMWFAFFLILEKLFWGKVLIQLPKVLRWGYSMAVVLVGWCFFSLEQTDKILLFLRAMFGAGSAGLINEKTLYLLSNYGLLLVLMAAGATPLGKRAALWLKNRCAGQNAQMKQSGRTGQNGCMGQHGHIGTGMFREKYVLPGIVGMTLAENIFLITVLLLSIANIVDASYNPFLYFRF